VSGDFIMRFKLTHTLVRLIPEEIHFFCEIQSTLGKRKPLDVYGE
jgi:hypothetical protein